MHTTRDERRHLESVIGRRSERASRVERACALLLLTRGGGTQAVAERLGRDSSWVRRLRQRFEQEGLAALDERKRSGRPQQYTAELRCELIAMACAKPKDYGIEHRNVWTYGLLRDTFATCHPELDRAVSKSWVVHTLLAGEIRPQRMRLWLHSPDPMFRVRVNEICQLYREPPAGSIVLCVDEKTGIQALGRKHPTRMPGVGRAGRFEYEYKRNGTRALIAAFNPHDGEVFGEMRATRTGDDLIEFMEALAAHYPEGEIHIVWDNLNIHHDGPSQRWTRFNTRHRGRFHFHYTPIHASWVNQVELWFSVLSRRVLRYGVFDSLAQLDAAVVGFMEHWNEREACAFNWSFKGYPLEMGREEAEYRAAG